VTPTLLNLREASDRLDVHYMTVYRYVRTGRLIASKLDGEWRVDVRDLERMRSAVPAIGRRGRPGYAKRIPDLAERLLASDETGAWGLVDSVLAGGAAPSAVYLELFIPALRLIGERWSRGETSVADEHAATVTMQRVIGRMGPLFRRRGRPRGILVLGAPAGELHAMPTALVADLLRARGFVVIDLGASVPTESFVECVRRLPRLIAVGIAVTTSGQEAVVGRLVRALRGVEPRVPVVVGGAGITELEAQRLAADHWTDSAPTLVRLLVGQS
jgi:methanogenic corrinoid protein MtbC1